MRSPRRASWRSRSAARRVASSASLWTPSWRRFAGWTSSARSPADGRLAAGAASQTCLRRHPVLTSRKSGRCPLFYFRVIGDAGRREAARDRGCRAARAARSRAHARRPGVAAAPTPGRAALVRGQAGGRRHPRLPAGEPPGGRRARRVRVDRGGVRSRGLVAGAGSAAPNGSGVSLGGRQACALLAHRWAGSAGPTARHRRRAGRPRTGRWHGGEAGSGERHEGPAGRRGALEQTVAGQMNRELIMIIEQLGREKGIDKEVLFEALETALLSASRKSLGPGDNVRIHIDRKTGDFRIYQRKQVVEEVTDPETQIALADAKALNPEAELGVELELLQDRPLQDLGRIAAQTAKQVILQKVRDAEREGIYSEFVGKEGQILRGVVHRIEKRNVILEVGKAEAILPEREQIPGERYNPGDRVRAYVLEVRRTAKGPQISLSRTHPGYLTRLFETEIPEIQEGIVIVKATAREGGERATVAVSPTKRDVDPIGPCVGLRGTRIQVISRELRGEKIDIIEWSNAPASFVARALSPAKVSSVTIAEEPAEGGEAHGETHMAALVVVPDNQLSLAIGKKGQNARLAAQLTGMRIDIKSEGEVEAERAEAEHAEAARAALSTLPR